MPYGPVLIEKGLHYFTLLALPMHLLGQARLLTYAILLENIPRQVFLRCPRVYDVFVKKAGSNSINFVSTLLSCTYSKMQCPSNVSSLQLLLFAVFFAEAFIRAWQFSVAFKHRAQMCCSVCYLLTVRCVYAFPGQKGILEDVKRKILQHIGTFLFHILRLENIYGM